MSSLAASGGRRWRQLAVFQVKSLDNGKRRTITKAYVESLVQARRLEGRQRPPTTTARRPPNGFVEDKKIVRRFQTYIAMKTTGIREIAELMGQLSI
jgi:hypothetical protein